MKIDPRSPREVAAGRPVQRAAGAGAARATAAAGAGASAPVRDVTSVLGIPETEFTPKVRQAIMTLMAEVDALRRDLQVAQSRLKSLEQLADQDTLAPIPNRRAFVRELSRTMSYVERYETPAAVLYFGVNDLKKINDTFGHATGDAALMHVARLLGDNIRDTDTVGRLGGDEFGVILSHADEAQAAEKGAALAKVIEDTPFRWQDKLLRLSVSWGSYSFRSAGDPAHALDAADRQMYLRKKGVVRD